MPERAVVTQGVQIGVETTSGTTVPANKQLQSLSISPEIHIDSTQFQPVGQKVPSIVVPNKEWSEMGLTGVLDYTEIIYPLSGILGTAVSVVQQAATTAYLWTFTPAARTSDSYKTFTIEQGDANRAQRLSYALLSEFEVTLTRGGATIGGKAFGQAITDGATLTASPTALLQKPVIPNQIDVYMDATSAALGTTKLTRAFETKIAITNRNGPLWALNSANGSFASNVEMDPVFTLTLKVEADAQGMAFLTTLRNGTTQFVRVKCTSPDLAGTAFPFSITFDMAMKVATPSTYEDEAGVYAITWTCPLVNDTTWGKFFTAAVINQQTAL